MVGQDKLQISEIKEAKSEHVITKMCEFFMSPDDQQDNSQTNKPL